MRRNNWYFAMPNKRRTIEDVFGEFGFRVRWEVEDHWASVQVYEIVSIEIKDEVRIPEFFQKNWTNSADTTPSIDGAEAYIIGFVKWDGCSELDQGCPHWCSPDDYKKHIKLLEYIYKRAFELMGRAPNEFW